MLPPPTGVASNAGIRYWWGGGINGIGDLIVGIVKGGFVYISKDFGRTWLENTSLGKKNWQYVAVSQTGQHIALVESYAVNAADPNEVLAGVGNIYVSNDYGETFNITNAGIKPWNTVAISSDGSTIAASTSSEFNQDTAYYIHVSRDFGATWSVKTNSGSRNWRNIAISSNGQKMVAVTYETGGVVISNDYGETWDVKVATSNLLTVSMSGDGNKIIYTGQNKVPQISSDGGNTFTSLALSSGLAVATACSQDGSILGIGYYGGNYMVSKNGGATWTIAPIGQRQWFNSKSNASGSLFIVPAFANALYILNT